MEVIQVSAVPTPPTNVGEINSDTVTNQTTSVNNTNNVEPKSEVTPSPDEENEATSSLDKDTTTKDKSNKGANPQAPTTGGGHRRGRRSGGSRGGRGRRSSGKKEGSWKKIDAEVGLGKSKDDPNKQSEKGNEDNKEDEPNHDHPDAQDGTASSSSSSHSKSNGRRRSGNNRRRGGRRNRGGGGGVSGGGGSAEANLNWRSGKRPSRSRNSNSRQQPYVTMVYESQNNNGLELVKKAAVGQIEYFFSADELCKNTFLRNHMDTEGYLPAAIVFNFPSVIKYSIPYAVLLETVAKSESLDVDMNNETIRINGDYKKWLFPNEEGGFGCPRWIKQAPELIEETPVSHDEGNPQAEA